MACFDPENIGPITFPPPATVSIESTATGRRMTFSTDQAYSVYRIRAGETANLQSL
jgi:hypothetical protein